MGKRAVSYRRVSTSRGRLWPFRKCDEQRDQPERPENILGHCFLLNRPLANPCRQQVCALSRELSRAISSTCGRSPSRPLGPKLARVTPFCAVTCWGGTQPAAGSPARLSTRQQPRRVSKPRDSQCNGAFYAVNGPCIRPTARPRPLFSVTGSAPMPEIRTGRMARNDNRMAGNTCFRRRVLLNQVTLARDFTQQTEVSQMSGCHPLRRGDGIEAFSIFGGLPHFPC